MVFAVLNALFLYGLIWLFERQRRALHEFDFSKIAVIPIFAYLILSVLVMLFSLGNWGNLVALIVFLASLFWMLWKKAQFSPARAAAYCGGILGLNIVLSLVWVLVVGPE